MDFKDKERIIQEFVPGKQITLAHIIANPDEGLYQKLGLIDGEGALGIFTITPSEAAIIAADVASKSADVQLGFVDRFNGSLVITGDVAAIQAADTAAKAAEVVLLEIRTGYAIGGKGFVTLSGDVAAVQTAIDHAVEEQELLVSTCVLPRPDPALFASLL